MNALIRSIWLHVARSALILALVIAPAHAQDAGTVLQDLLRGLQGNETQGQRRIVPPDAENGRRLPFGRQDMQLSFAPLVADTGPSVVNVYAARQVQRRTPFAGDPFFEQFFGDQFRGPPRVQSSLGSGVIVEKDGLVVTNNHVIEGMDEIKIALSDGREYESQVVLRDQSSDLAVLRIQARGEVFPALQLGDSDDLLTGDLVLAIGNPFGVGQTITSGIVSALARTRVGVSDFGFFIQTDAAINPGNSGGALIDMNGRLVGINTAIFSRSGGSNGIGFAIPSNMVRAVIDQAKGGASAFERPYLGAYYEPVTSRIAESLGLRRVVGALVSEVDEDSPAANAGIRVGDVILGVDGAYVEHPDALDYRLATVGAGNFVSIDILSQGRQKTVRVGLAHQPAPKKDARIEISGRNPFSGTMVADINSAVARELRLAPGTKGAVVIAIQRNSFAARYGIRPGDVVMSINGKDIGSAKELEAALKEDTRSWRYSINRGGNILRQFIRF